MNSLSNFQIPDAWEVKDVVNKLKSVVLNYTEMEAKVHEATNNEPWGASSTLMQEIAQGTYNYQYFNEIMPTVYRRFTEKESKQWRQIYKALVLLEYLIKNGSERVVDDARSHVSMIKVMRNFYYIDDKGKDEGLNVRNRAKEIVELLGNTDKIRSERKLAKKNRNKYTGVGSDSAGGMRSMGLGGAGYGGGSKYVGFGSDSYNGGGGGISFNGDALSFGEETPYPHQSGRYDEDDEDQGGYHSESNEDAFASSSTSKKATDDFDTKQSNDDDWGDFTWGEPTASTQETKPNSSNNILDDDFADFQHAVADEPVQTAAPKKSQQQDLFDLLGDDTTSTPSTPSAAHPQQQSLHMFETKQPMIPSSQQHQQQQQQQQPPKQEEKKVEASTPTGMWAQASNFVSLDSLGKKSSNTTQSTGPSMNALKNTSVQADWNNWASNNQTKPAAAAAPPPAAKPSSAFDDLLF